MNRHFICLLKTRNIIIYQFSTLIAIIISTPACGVFEEMTLFSQILNPTWKKENYFGRKFSEIKVQELRVLIFKDLLCTKMLQNGYQEFHHSQGPRSKFLSGGAKLDETFFGGGDA